MSERPAESEVLDGGGGIKRAERLGYRKRF